MIGDLGPHNILVDDAGRVTAVVDLEMAWVGDRVIDVVGLLYAVEPALHETVRGVALEVASADAVTVAGVHWVVRRVANGLAADDATQATHAERLLEHLSVLT